MFDVSYPLHILDCHPLTRLLVPYVFPISLAPARLLNQIFNTMHAHVQKLVIFGLITLLILSWSSFLIPRQVSPAPDQETVKPIDESPIYNQTLGV